LRSKRRRGLNRKFREGKGIGGTAIEKDRIRGIREGRKGVRKENRTSPGLEKVGKCNIGIDERAKKTKCEMTVASNKRRGGDGALERGGWRKWVQVQGRHGVRT